MFEVRTVQAPESCTLVELHLRMLYVYIDIRICILYGDCATIGT